mmetsp:Transcript_81920/g.228318  ORF Transcript_81920/g.228318 Transcript_81920/m.228318 type:complete len:424 (-) Transcript_81920:81-1352(-)
MERWRPSRSAGAPPAALALASAPNVATSRRRWRTSRMLVAIAGSGAASADRRFCLCAALVPGSVIMPSFAVQARVFKNLRRVTVARGAVAEQDVTLAHSAAWPHGRCPGLFLEPEELQAMATSSTDSGVSAHATLPFSDPRVRRLADVVRGRGGSFPDCEGGFWCGVAGVGADDNARLRWRWPVGREEDIESKAEAKRLSKPRRERKRRLKPEAIDVLLGETQPYGLFAPPPVDLLLAVPRPQQLERILPHVAQLGVGTLVLCNAAKVDSVYFNSSTLLETSIRRLLGYGLAQARDARMPRIHLARDLEELLEPGGALDEMVPRDSAIRLVAHPGIDGDATPEMHELESGLELGKAAPRRVLVAVGPEAGWDEPAELELLGRAGFAAVSAGPRVLRSDVAVVTLLALAEDLAHRLDGVVAGDT